MPAAQQALPRPGGSKRPDAAARGRLCGPCVPMFRQAAVLTFFRRFPANVLKGVRQRVRPAVPVMYQRSRGRAAAFMNRIRPSGRSPRAAPCSFFPHWGHRKTEHRPAQTKLQKRSPPSPAWRPRRSGGTLRAGKPTRDTVSIRMRHCGPPCLTRPPTAKLFWAHRVHLLNATLALAENHVHIIRCVHYTSLFRGLSISFARIRSPQTPHPHEIVPPRPALHCQWGEGAL